jgi:hypothetical protein
MYCNYVIISSNIIDSDTIEYWTYIQKFYKYWKIKLFCKK